MKVGTSVGGNLLLVEIVIRGNLETLLRYCLQMKGVSALRKSTGWELFQDDEDWTYEAQMDERVCPTCREYDIIKSFSGSRIPLEFPAREVLDSKTELYPRVHKTRPWLKGICRCIMRWIGASIVLAERFGRELIAAMR